MLNYSNLEDVLVDIFLYQEPNTLKNEYVNFLDNSNINLVNIKKYEELLLNIKYAHQKTLRYEFYFQEFYPDPEKITAIEALNHHIHSYLEDSDILKEKILTFLNNLSKDIKGTLGGNETEKSKVREFFNACIEKTREVFWGIVEHRNSHHHSGMRFIDGDLLKAENALNYQKFFENNIFKQMLKPDKVHEFMQKIKQEKEESFEKAKGHWIKMAQNNNNQSSGYINTLFEMVAPSLYQFLEIRPTNTIPELKNLKDKANLD